jgi:two-component system, NtrC family, C4-dicarboxylate transport sensor histidine kinase DctB
MMDEPLGRPGPQARLGVAAGWLDRLLHDIKQPLNLIRIEAQSTRLDADERRVQVESLPDSMRTIEKAVCQVADQLDRLRGFARRRGARSKEKSLDPAQACDQAVQVVRAQYPDLQVAVALAPDLPLAAAEPVGFAHALWEIVDNAAQAALQGTSGPGRVQVSVQPAGRMIAFEVRDNGCGMPGSMQSEIFEPFFSTRSDALGLGLALAQLLVEDAGGAVALADSDANGWVFEVSLPVVGSAG